MDQWLIWDVDNSLWWRRAGDDYDFAANRADATKFTLTEAWDLVRAVNDSVNDPRAAAVPVEGSKP